MLSLGCGNKQGAVLYNTAMEALAVLQSCFTRGLRAQQRQRDGNGKGKSGVQWCGVLAELLGAQQRHAAEHIEPLVLVP